MKTHQQHSTKKILLLLGFILILIAQFTKLYAQVAATVTVGPGGTYTSFTNTGGLFAAINTFGMNQNVTATVIGNITETGANNLNQFASPHSLTIRPNSATERVITITAQDTLFVFRGTDRVTVDGSFNGSGRFLRFVGNNSARVNTQSLFFLYDGATNLEFKNCIFESNTENKNNGIFYIGEPSASQANENITIRGNIFRGVTGSFYVNAITSIGFGDNRPKNVNIIGNDFARFSLMSTGGASTVILFHAIENSRIDSNSFYAMDTATILTATNDIINVDQAATKLSRGVSINYNSFGGFNANRSGAFFYPKMSGGSFYLIRARFDSLPGNEVRGNRVGNIGANNRPEYRHGVFFLMARGSVNVYDNIIGGKQNAWDTVTTGYDNGWITVVSSSYTNPDTIKIYNNLISDSRYNKGQNDRQSGIFISVSSGNIHVRVFDNVIRNFYGNHSTNSLNFCMQGIRITNNPTSSSTLKVYNNVIHDLHTLKDNTSDLTDVGQLVIGINAGNFANSEYFNNRIFNLTTSSLRALDTGTNVPVAVGIYVNGAGSNYSIFNNQISLSSNSRSVCQGIYTISSTAFVYPKIYNNSIYISGNAPAALPSERSSCIAYNATRSIQAFNNVLFNNRGAMAPSYTIDVKRNDYVGDSSFQNNLFVNPTANIAYWPVAGNNEHTLTSWNALGNFDTASTAFTTAQVSAASFFTHVDTANLSVLSASRNYVAGKGIAVDGVDVDVNGNARSNPPSIGAHEYAAVSSSNITVTGTLNGYTTCEGDTSAQQSFTVAGTGLSGNISITAPTGFEVSTTSGTGFATSLTLTPASGAVATTTIYARISSSATGNPSGNIVVASTGATTRNVAVTGTVNALPTIALGSVSSVLTNATSFSLPYSATTGTPNQYSVTTGSPTAMSGFTAVSNANLGSSPISIMIPASAANTYNFNLTVRNSTTGCVSANVPFTLTVTAPGGILNNTISSAQTICSGATPAALSGSTPTGGTGTFTYTWLRSTTSATTGFAAAAGTNNTINYNPPALTQNTWFRRLVESGSSIDTSTAVLITVNTAIATNTITSAAQAICNGATPSAINASAATGGDGTTYTYQWLSSTTNATNGFTAIGSSNIQNFTPGALTQSTWYRRVASSGVCNADTTAAYAITVNPLPTITLETINSVNALATSFSIPYSATTGSPNQYSIAAGSPTAMPGFTSVSNASLGASPISVSIPASATNTYNFNLTVRNTSTGCVSAVVPITLTVTSGSLPIANNTISTSQIICSGAAPAQLTGSTPTGGNDTYTYTWLKSTTDSVNGFTAIPSSNTINYTSGALTQTTWFKRYVVSGVSTDTSAAIKITVADTTRPVVRARNLTVYLTASGSASITASQADSASTDNCSIQSRTVSTSSFTCANIGSNSVKLIVTDASGNKDSANFTVMVLDTIKPVVNVQGGMVLYLNANGTTSLASSLINNGSTDNCGIASISVSPSTLNCSHLGVTPVTLTVTDVNGNIATAVTNVVVLDPIAPVARPKARLNLYLSGNGQAVINPALLDSASSDNCTLTSRLLSQSVFNCSNIGTNNVTFTVQDQSGNSHAAIVQVTVIDTIAPVATVSNQLVYLNNAGTASITAAMVNNNSTDNCGIQSVSISKSTFTCSDLGTSSINFTVTDVNGNFRTAPVVINVFDTIRPVMRPKQNVVVYLNALGTANIDLSMVDSASSDNCNLATRTLSKSQFGCADLGVNTLTLTGTDSKGNIGTAQFNLTVLDTIRPTLTTRSATIYVNATGNAILNPSDVILSGTDNCSAAPIAALSKSNFNCTNLGANTVSVTLTDASGNFRSATASVTVLDTIKPTAIGQNRTIYLNALGTATITAGQVNNGSTDNCSVQSLSISKTNFTAADLGANLVTLTVTDQSNNSSQTQVLITVIDTIKPIVTTQNRTIYLNASGVATITASQINNGSTDNVSISAVQLSKTLFTCSDLGNNQVVLTVIDGSNNSQTGTATVTVVDTIKPIVNTQNITLYLNGIGQATLTPAQANNGSSDNCGVSNLSLSKTLFTCADRGNNTVQLQVTDASNNSASGSLQVTVLDTIRPNVVVNNNLTLFLNASGTATLTNAMVGNGSTDNCGITSQSLSKTSFNGTNLGLNLVNYTIADASGNTNSVILNITVVDTIRPTISVQNRTLYLDATGNAILTPAMVNNGSTDNVGITLQQLSKTNFNCNNIGLNQVLFTIEDASGNQISALATITVLDTIKPNAIARNLTVYLNANGTATITPAQANNGSTDNCSSTTLSLSKSEFSCANLGVNTVTLTVNDGSSNANTANFTVTVLDTIRPTLLVNPMVMVYLDSNGQATLSTDQVNLSSFDNCSAISFTLSKTSFNGLNLGMNQVIFTATDGSNNVRTANISVNVVDTVRPRIRAKNITLHLGSGGFVFLTPAEVDNGSTDNVGVTFSSLSKTVFNCNETGTNVIEYFIQDISGNRSSTWVTVTVLDTMMPVITSFPQSVVLGHCNNDFQFVLPTATDNCSQVTIKQTTGIGNGKRYPVGVTTNTFTFTDRSGNVVTRSFTVTILPAYLPDTFPNITVCSSNPPFDLTRGNANVVFSGSGVTLDGKQFDPGLSGPGNHAVVCTFTDSTGCETKINFFVTVHRSPDKPMIERMNSDVLQVMQSFDFYQWRRNYEDIPGANQRAYTMTRTGIYSVRVGTVQGCTTESDPIGVGVTLSVGNVKEGINFNLFPNPTQDRFTVDVDNLRGNAGYHIQVYDGIGRLIYTAEENTFSHSVETCSWSPGTYFVHIQSGKEKAVKPLIIAK